MEKFYISVEGAFRSGWFVFDDGEERPMRNGLVRKNSHIAVPYSKRKKRIIEEFRKGGIIETFVR